MSACQSQWQVRGGRDLGDAAPPRRTRIDARARGWRASCRRQLARRWRRPRILDRPGGLVLRQAGQPCRPVEWEVLRGVCWRCRSKGPAKVPSSHAPWRRQGRKNAHRRTCIGCGCSST
eukprot:scaffold2707_cov417-Prasinococcus_capsulatus_cf.AAC.18